MSMRIVRLTIVAAAVAFAGIAHAAERLVVVELFTSQGCSSCPPADAILAELATRSDVLPLALHVDYWDYIGWKDHFASPAFTQRQRIYARHAGDRTIYTPQMIVGGKDHVIGTKPMKLSQIIERHHGLPEVVDFQIEKAGGRIRIVATALKSHPGRYDVNVVTYLPSETVEIRKGENAGRTIVYSNIVKGIRTVGHWNGVGGFEAIAPAEGAGEKAAVMVQREGQGPVLAAARVP
jgi:hypothetical protein